MAVDELGDSHMQGAKPFFRISAPFFPGGASLVDLNSQLSIIHQLQVVHLQYANIEVLLATRPKLPFEF